MDISPFSLLPSELRNLIWEYTLHERSGVLINTQPGLLQTCKSIRAEAELMFYAVNYFRANIEEDNIQHHVCKWLQALGETKRRLICGLRVHCVIASTVPISEATDDSIAEEDQDSFMQLMHLLDSIRSADFGRQVEEVVSFTVGSTANNADLESVFDDTKSFQEMDQMSLEKQECYRAAKFLILCCVYGKEVLVDAMHSHDNGAASIAELDRRIQERRRSCTTALSAFGR